GDLGYDLRDDLGDVGHLRNVSLPGIQLGGDCKVPQLGETPADIFDVLMYAENFLDDQDHRKRPARGGHRAIGRNLAVLNRNRDFSGIEVLRISRDRLSGNRLNGKSEPRGQARDNEVPAREIDFGYETQQFLVHVVNSSKVAFLRS